MFYIKFYVLETLKGRWTYHSREKWAEEVGKEGIVFYYIISLYGVQEWKKNYADYPGRFLYEL